MYRCGNTFSQQPCSSDAKELKIPRGASVPEVNGAAKNQTSEADRLNKLTEESQKERRRWDVRDRLLPGAKAALAQHKQNCEATQARLSAQQYEYVQNMYGKVHAAQKASEMAAAAARCDMEERELARTVEKLTAECEATDCKRF